MYAKIAIDKPDLTDTTVGRIHATLHNALREAVKRRLINHNPADQVELRSANTQERSIWTPQQLALFLATSASDRPGFAFRLLAMTGLRRGETLGLRWQDVDLDHGSLRVVQQLVDVNGRLHFGPPKTKKGARTLAVAPPRRPLCGSIERRRTESDWLGDPHTRIMILSSLGRTARPLDLRT